MGGLEGGGSGGGLRRGRAEEGAGRDAQLPARKLWWRTLPGVPGGSWGCRSRQARDAPGAPVPGASQEPGGTGSVWSCSRRVPVSLRSVPETCRALPWKAPGPLAVAWSALEPVGPIEGDGFRVEVRCSHYCPPTGKSASLSAGLPGLGGVVKGAA